MIYFGKGADGISLFFNSHWSKLLSQTCLKSNVVFKIWFKLEDWLKSEELAMCVCSSDLLSFASMEKVVLFKCYK